MSKNRDPQPALESSSEEEEDEQSESESETESDSESKSEGSQIPFQIVPSLPPKETPESSKITQQLHSSSEDSESGSDSESEESDPAIPPSPPKPTPAVVVQKSTSKKDTASQANSSQPKSPASKVTASKRKSETNGLSATDNKKAKKNTDALESGEGTGSKKPLFQRIWSEDNELVVLRGMVDYMKEHKVDASFEMSSFYEFISDKLDMNMTKDQLQNKIRTLKKKFANNKSKEVDGEDRVFSKQHEHIVYQLSKEIWGKPKNLETPVSGTISNVSKKAKKKKKNSVSDLVEKTPVVENVPNGVITGDANADLMIYKGNKNSINLTVEEVEMYVKDLNIQIAQAQLVLDVLKSRKV